MQYATHMPAANRARLVPLATAILGAAVATATFALINIEDKPSLSAPTPAVQPATSAESATQRYDGGPLEGTAQQNISPASSSVATGATRYDGGPLEGAAQQNISPASSSVATGATRYDGGPEEGSRGVVTSQPPADGSAEANSFGARP